MVLGIALLVAGAALLVAEAHVPAAGALGAPGLAALVGGIALTITAAGGGLALALPLALAAAVAAAGFLGVAARKSAEAHHQRVRGGAEDLVGRIGVVRSPPAPVGQVFVNGALWRARAAWNPELDGDLKEGDEVIIDAVDGLTVSVRRAEDWEVLP